MNEQEFQELLTKIELAWDERGEELLEILTLMQYHKWLDKEGEDHSYIRRSANS